MKNEDLEHAKKRSKTGKPGGERIIFGLYLTAKVYMEIYIQNDNKIKYKFASKGIPHQYLSCVDFLTYYQMLMKKDETAQGRKIEIPDRIRTYGFNVLRGESVAFGVLSVDFTRQFMKTPFYKRKFLNDDFVLDSFGNVTVPIGHYLTGEEAVPMSTHFPDPSIEEGGRGEEIEAIVDGEGHVMDVDQLLEIEEEIHDRIHLLPKRPRHTMREEGGEGEAIRHTVSRGEVLCKCGVQARLQRNDTHKLSRYICKKNLCTFRESIVEEERRGGGGE
jgi:hypothetical protein